jgi:aminopeptidase N
MRLRFIMLFLVFGFTFVQAQEASKINPVYRAEREKINDLVHTKLKVKFDFSKRQMTGEEWVTLTPHFYPTSTLTLDAKAMLIHEITLNGKKLKYEYNDKILEIKLGTTFHKGEEYTVYIKYTARPEEVKQEGSAAITDAKGLYFIDPDGTDPDKPTQIWTQGETESSSCWFPTIDSPNQKSTEEIYITVPEKYTTLSNGILKNQVNNSDGTRTDYWKLDQKHAPYLFFMGIGEYSVVKDTWNNIPVNYYVEKEYEPYAKEIFGKTPKMIQFFSDYTGLKYVWPKYSQMVARDYVSGAMENTTAVLHAEMVYQVPGQLIDKNGWESTIAHELFHHWFGDYVTTESWSNLTVNESFANYSEYLWLEHEYGKDEADAHRYTDLQGYFMGGNEMKDLVRFYYNSNEDMFDAVSYNKGGGILHMLRALVGDDAFRQSLKTYLDDNAYGTGEAHQLRLAFEKVTGKDMNPFFNQWFFGAGHPKLEITYDYSDAQKLVAVNIKQTQDKLFDFPLFIEVYEGATPKRYEVRVDKKNNAYSFKYTKKPELIVIDPDHTLLAQIKDDKTVENYIFQYNHAPRYDDRRQAIEELSKNQDNKVAFETLTKAMNDKYYGLRIMAIKKIDISSKYAGKAIKTIEGLARNDKKTLVQAAAIKKLGQLKSKGYASIYKNALKSKSFSVKGSAMAALYEIDKNAALTAAKSITDKTTKDQMQQALIPIFILDKTESEMPFVADHLIEGMFFTEDTDTQKIYKDGFEWIASSDNEAATRNLTDSFVSVGIKYKQYGADQMAKQVLNQVLALKKSSKFSNRDQLVKIVEDGLKKLD